MPEVLCAVVPFCQGIQDFSFGFFMQGITWTIGFRRFCVAFFLIIGRIIIENRVLMAFLTSIILNCASLRGSLGLGNNQGFIFFKVRLLRGLGISWVTFRNDIRNIRNLDLSRVVREASFVILVASLLKTVWSNCSNLGLSNYALYRFLLVFKIAHVVILGRWADPYIRFRSFLKLILLWEHGPIVIHFLRGASLYDARWLIMIVVIVVVLHILLWC
jgi:hypothetical protein